MKTVVDEFMSPKVDAMHETTEMSEFFLKNGQVSDRVCRIGPQVQPWLLAGRREETYCTLLNAVRVMQSECCSVPHSVNSCSIAIDAEGEKQEH